MKKFTVAIILLFLLAACGNRVYDKAIEDAKLALAGGEIDKAYGLYELALEEKPKDEEAKKALQQLNEFNEVKGAIEEADWDEALLKAKKMIALQKLPSSLKKELHNYIKLAEKQKEQNKTITNNIEGIKTQINNLFYEEAQNQLDALINNEEFKTGLTQFTSEVNELKNAIIAGIQQQKNDEEEKVKAESKAKEEQAKVNEEKAKKKQANSTKKLYLNKLSQIEVGLSDLDYLFETGVTSDLIEASAEVYDRYDKVLNEIYGVLKKQLSEKDMKSLQDKQRQWIKDMDKQAAEDTAYYEDGSFASVQRLSTLGQLTEQRCYELVHQYMK